MTDEEAIQRVLTTYSQAASIKDWDSAVGTFLPEGIWEIPHLGLKLEGREAVLGTVKAFMDTMDYVIQMNAPALITVNGDTATARSAIRECGKTRDKDEGFEFLGFYADELARTQDGWKFVRRVFEGCGTHYFPLVSGERTSP